MAKLNIRIHECGSSASSLGPSPMGVLRVGRPRKDMLASKKNESAAMTEEAVLALLDELNLVVDNKWFDGDNTIPVFDCRDKHDDSGELVSVRVEPPYEARVWYTDRNPRNNGFTEGIESIEDLKSTLAKFFDLELSESKKNESDDGLDAEWDDLVAVLNGLFLRDVNEPSGKYFYVKSDYRNDDDILHSVYNKGQDTLFLEIHLVGTEPNMAVVNPGNYTDETFDKAYGVVESVAQEMFRSLDADGYHGTISKIDDASEYGDWKKQHGFEDKFGDAPIDWDDFDAVVRQVLWNDETKPKVCGKVYRSIPADVDNANMPSAVHICTLDDDTPMITIFPDYSKDYRGDIYVYNDSLDSKTYKAVDSRMPQIARSVEDANSGNVDYPLYTHVFPSKDAMTKYLDSQDESRHSASEKNESGEDAQAVLQANYGDGNTYYGESSADGFYATERHPMAWAILNNDVAELEALHNGTVATPDKPWNCHGWSEDVDAPEDSDGNYPYVYNMDTDYNETFVEDMPDRVVGETDNQDALRKALEYYPDFVLPIVDFWNAFHKGYDKDLLLSFLYNARNLYNDMQVDIQEYLDYDEFGKDAYNNLESFLEGN